MPASVLFWWGDSPWQWNEVRAMNEDAVRRIRWKQTAAVGGVVLFAAVVALNPVARAAERMVLCEEFTNKY
jgi:hypothetical protein